jgi:imidazolonepropionase-like amidohydrolase
MTHIHTSIIMRAFLRRAFVSMLAAYVAAGACSAHAQRITVFTNVRLIDGRGGAPSDAMTVVVRGSTIAAIGPIATTAAPTGALIVAGKGRTLMPGLADMHVHLTGGWDGERTDLLGFPGYLDALLYAGVTTVHDLGNVLPYVQQLKQEISAGRLRGPRLYMVGALVDGANPIWPPLSFALTSVGQAPNIVRQMKRGGADDIKAYIGLNEALLSGLVRAASAESLRVIADLGFANGSDMGIRAGIAAYAHAGTRPMADSTIAAMKASGASNISTLAVLESFSERRLADLSFLRMPLLADVMPPWFVTELTAHSQRTLAPIDTLRRARFATSLSNAKANILRLHQAGVPIIAGTDSPYPGVYFGEGLHRELELLVEAGLTPLEAISAATGNAAAFMLDSTWGVVAVGRRADLLLIDGRPDQRISDTRRIVQVMQAGRIVPRAQLTFAAQKRTNFRATGAPLSVK